MKPVLIILVSVIAAGCAGQSVMRRHSHGAAYGSYLRGLMFERDSDLLQALEAYRAALERDPRSALLNVRIGATYLKLGDMDLARQFFERALVSETNQPDALRWVAMLHASQGELREAMTAYERLLTVEPDDHLVLSTLADLYVLQGEFPKAIACYHRLIETVGSTSQLHFNLGVLYGRLEQFDDAIQELSRALERSPDSVEIRVALGLTYELSGQFDQAAAHYEEASRLDPLNPRLYHHAARAYVNGKHLAEAASTYQAILDLTPRDLDAIMGLVRVRLAQRQLGEATQFLAQGLRTLGDLAELYVALGLVYREAQYPEEAMRAFERAVAAQEDSASAHFYLGAQLDQVGQEPDARVHLRRTLELDPHHADAMNYLGYLDAESGQNLDAAKALIERAIELDPENGAYIDSLGWVYYKMGRLDEAIRYLERAAAMQGSDPVIFDHLGDAYFKRQDLEKARWNWQRALELDETQRTIKEKLEQVVPDRMTMPVP